MNWPGEKQAWDILTELDTNSVQSRACVSFDHGNSSYRLNSLGQDIYICIKSREILCPAQSGKLLVTQLEEYSRLPILRYLIDAKDIPVTERLVRPADLPGGGMFTKGTHVLPLDELSSRFSSSPEEFIERGKRLGGTPLEYGDASIKLLPFPRVPVSIILWTGDDEFPSRSAFLFDSSCMMQLETDILWSTAMMSLKLLLSDLSQ